MRWLGVVNLTLLGMILLVATLLVFPIKEENYPSFVSQPEQKELPKSPFAESDEFFQEIGEGVFALKWVPPQMQLPDLRQELLFCGKNARPDSLPGRSSFHVSLKGSGERLLVHEGERVYLVYQGNYSPKERSWDVMSEQMTTSPTPLWGDLPAREAAEGDREPYVFSPGNQPTPLWFEVKGGSEQTVEVRLSMLDEKGALVLSPADLRLFQLHLAELPKSQLAGWELGGYRVDATLLVRQKARWAGPDLFLECHGGDEFASVIGKERIDFFDGESPYSCFVSGGDFLIWQGGRWMVPQMGEETQQFPLMVIKKIDEKLISFELWDPEGRGKTLLSLIRSKDHHGMPDLSQEFKFVGAKTWAQFIVECRTGGRMTLKPHDWLVLTQDGWIKLDSPSQIDAFVDQSIIGPLFILDKMAKKNGRQVLIGHVFNTARTAMEEVELTSSSSTPLANFYRQIPLTPPIQPKPVEIEGCEE
jgi:hypothetical protein